MSVLHLFIQSDLFFSYNLKFVSYFWIQEPVVEERERESLCHSEMGFADILYRSAIFS